MKLSQLLSILPQVNWSQRESLMDQEVTSLCFDTRQLEAACVFVAVRGEKFDAHDFLSEVVNSNPLALVVENESKVPSEFSGVVVVVDNSRQALNQLAGRFFGDPAHSLFSVGVTGTNGKTTTTYMVEAILTRLGYPTGVIGTINHHLGEHVWKTEMTTPDPISFQSRLSDFISLGAKAVALEVSSHALMQNRVDEVPFDVAIFTNLSRDHLDYHRDMEDYFLAKERLFRELLPRSKKPSKIAIVNDDDEYGRRIESATETTLWCYGLGEDTDLKIQVLDQGFSGTRFCLVTPHGEREFFVPMPGLHNVYNAAAAIGAGLLAGLRLGLAPQYVLEQCALGLETFTGVKGRLEPVLNLKGIHIFVDYAHTDGALKTVLHYLNGIRCASDTKNRIITVFGCGGDRDKGKRPLMMKAALNGSDLVVVTSDNPRTEDPESIIDDAFKGFDSTLIGNKVFRQVDRREGIRLAIQLAQPGDVVLIAGKGHEDYQQIGTTKHPFSDVEVVREILG